MSIEKVQEAMGLGPIGSGFKKHGGQQIPDEEKGESKIVELILEPRKGKGRGHDSGHWVPGSRESRGHLGECISS
jgi:hypothetical protein